MTRLKSKSFRTSVGRELTSATPTTVFTVPSGYNAELVYLRAANGTGSNRTITLSWVGAERDGTARTIDIWNATTINSNSTDVDNEVSLVLREGDTLEASIDSASTVDLVMTFDVYIPVFELNLE